jgi:uncharacterized protein
MNESSRPHLFGVLAGLFLAAGLVCSAMLATTAWLRIKNSQFISVKGSARKNIKSDLVIWRGAFSTEALTLIDAQRGLKGHRTKVEQFLRERGMTNANFTPISIEELKASRKDTNGFVTQYTAGFRLTQAVRVESPEVDHITRLDQETTALVEQGVLFTAQTPEFIYTKAGEVKVEMLAEATRDARTRAEQIALQGSRALASLHSADMGIFQITPLYSGQTSWQGENDTSSVEKTITAVVTATFILK